MHTPIQASEKKRYLELSREEAAGRGKEGQRWKGKGKGGKEGGRMQNLAVLLTAGRFSCDSPSLLRQ